MEGRASMARTGGKNGAEQFFLATLLLWLVSVVFEIVFNLWTELLWVICGGCFFQFVNWVVRSWFSRDPLFVNTSVSLLHSIITSASEIEMMKERFSKLLLGEDMSGSENGVCTALAISNAIINLCATLFGQLWRLEPLPTEKKEMWRREMEWLLCVSDHIVELTPTWQTFPDGSKLEEILKWQSLISTKESWHTNQRKTDHLLFENLINYCGRSSGCRVQLHIGRRSQRSYNRTDILG